MTREEAIAVLQEKHNECKAFYDLAACPEDAYPGAKEYMQALQMAIAALRGPTREQVENVWHGYRTSGCGVCLGSILVGYGSNKKCGTYFVDLDGNNLNIMGSRIRINFCPKCGRPLTDEAVDILLKRLEALHENDC